MFGPVSYISVFITVLPIHAGYFTQYLVFMYFIQHCFLRFYCVGGCLNLSPHCCDSGIDIQTL
jgi:hypothetical protein